MLTVKSKVMMMDKLDYKLDVKLVPWMEEMFVMMSKVELCED